MPSFFPFAHEKSSERNFLTEGTENHCVILFQINLLAELKIQSTSSLCYLTTAQKRCFFANRGLSFRWNKLFFFLIASRYGVQMNIRIQEKTEIAPPHLGCSGFHLLFWLSRSYKWRHQEDLKGVQNSTDTHQVLTGSPSGWVPRSSLIFLTSCPLYLEILLSNQPESSLQNRKHKNALEKKKKKKTACTLSLDSQISWFCFFFLPLYQKDVKKIVHQILRCVIGHKDFFLS